MDRGATSPGISSTYRSSSGAPCAGAIHSLPPELLGLIFSYLPRHTRRFILISVCRPWRAAALRSILTLTYSASLSKSLALLSNLQELTLPSRCIRNDVTVVPLGLRSLILPETFSSELDAVKPFYVLSVLTYLYLLDPWQGETAEPILLNNAASLCSLEILLENSSSYSYFAALNLSHLTSLRIAVSTTINEGALSPEMVEFVSRHSEQLRALRLMRRFRNINALWADLMAISYPNVTRLELADPYCNGNQLLALVSNCSPQVEVSLIYRFDWSLDLSYSERVCKAVTHLTFQEVQFIESDQFMRNIACCSCLKSITLSAIEVDQLDPLAETRYAPLVTSFLKFPVTYFASLAAFTNLRLLAVEQSLELSLPAIRLSSVTELQWEANTSTLGALADAISCFPRLRILRFYARHHTASAITGVAERAAKQGIEEVIITVPHATKQFPLGREVITRFPGTHFMLRRQ